MKSTSTQVLRVVCLLISLLMLSRHGLAQNSTDQNAPDINPYIEIEKYDSSTSVTLKDKATDKINVYSLFKMNSLTAKNRTSFQSFNLNTSTETEIGLEYSKYITEANRLFARVAANQFSMPQVTSLATQIDASGESQVSASVGGQYLFTTNNYIGYAANYRPHYYLVENAQSNLELDYAPSASVSLDTENQFYTASDYVIGAQFGVEYITNAKISGSELGFNLGVVYQQEFKASDKIRVELSYEQSNLDSINYNLLNNSIAMNFLYSLPF